MDSNQASNSNNKTWREWFFEPIEQANSLQRADDASKNLKAWCGLIGSVGCLLFLRFFFLQNEQYRLVKLLEFLHLLECEERTSAPILVSGTRRSIAY